jgi:hypothetical protein
LVPFAEQHYCCGYYGWTALVRKTGVGDAVATDATDALQRIALTVTARKTFSGTWIGVRLALLHYGIVATYYLLSEPA